jgi:hypothetical protein
VPVSCTGDLCGFGTWYGVVPARLAAELLDMPETARVKIKSRGAKLDFTQTAAAVV